MVRRVVYGVKMVGVFVGSFLGMLLVRLALESVGVPWPDLGWLWGI